MRRLKRVRYLKYRISARHRRGFGIHSPFMFYLITKVFRNKQYHSEYDLFEKVYGELKATETDIQNKEKPLNIRKYLFRNELRLKYGKLLFRVVRYFQPDLMWFHGKTLGMNLMYMQKAMANCPLICSGEVVDNQPYINRLFQRYDLKVDYCSDYALKLFITDQIRNARNPFIFINTPQAPEELLSIVSKLSEMKHGKAVIWVKAIHSSSEMEKTWDAIGNLDWGKDNPLVAVDLYLVGLLIIDTRLQKQSYVVNF